MTLPTIEDPATGTDSEGNQWVQALVNAKGEVLAGRDQWMNFHCLVDSEVLFDHAMTALYEAKGIDIPDLLKQHQTERSE